MQVAEFSGLSFLGRVIRPVAGAVKSAVEDAQARERMIVAGYEETQSQFQPADFSAQNSLLSPLR